MHNTKSAYLVKEENLMKQMLEQKMAAEKILERIQSEWHIKVEKIRKSHQQSLDKANNEICQLVCELNQNKTSENSEHENKIESLESIIAHLRTELKTAKEEMNFFRREVINREGLCKNSSSRSTKSQDGVNHNKFNRDVICNTSNNSGLATCSRDPGRRKQPTLPKI